MTKYELYKDVEETQKRFEKQIDVLLQCETNNERSSNNGKEDSQ